MGKEVDVPRKVVPDGELNADAPALLRCGLRGGSKGRGLYLLLTQIFTPIYPKRAHNTSITPLPARFACRAQVVGPDQSHAHAVVVKLMEGAAGQPRKKWVVKRVVCEGWQPTGPTPMVAGC